MINGSVIYSEPQDVFINDIIHNRVATKMNDKLVSLGWKAQSGPQYRSWQNSPIAIKHILEYSGIKDTYVTFEYSIPYSEFRIDCMLYGRNIVNKGYVMHIELKQWNDVTPTHIEGNFVETYTGTANRIVAHPSQQVRGYHDYLTGLIEVFEQGELGLFGCSYCHNYNKEEGQGLYDPIYTKILSEFPVYSGNEVDKITEKVKEFLGQGDGLSIYNKFMKSAVRPSRKILESASKIVKNESDFTLLGDQIIARNTIIQKIKNATKSKGKSIVIINGGPGTGKTVIALHILAEIASSRIKRKVFFATKSQPLREGIKFKIKGNRDARILFTNLNQYIPSKVDENEIDVLIIDEAHRIGTTPNNRFTKAQHQTDLQQVETLIRAAKTSVFFIDDKQIIRNAEVGSTPLIEEFGKKYNCKIEKVELISQFRCNGSVGYIDWVETILGYSDAHEVLMPQDNYDFKVFSSPDHLYEELLKKNNGTSTSRLTAGFCWPWSNQLDSNGQLVRDVKIGTFSMPWETHGDINRPPEGYVKWYEWAYKPEGIKQVGCIYTAQGFEFDYVGVIIGPDIYYDPESCTIKTDISKTKDPTLRIGAHNFDNYVRNIYRVLLTRGLKGCYVYCVDKELEQYLRTKILILNKELA